jgi:integrase
MGNRANDEGERPRKRKQRSVRSATYRKGSIYQDQQGRWWYQPPQKDGQRLPRVRCEDRETAELAQADWLKQQQAGVNMAAAHQPLGTWLWFWHDNHITPMAAPSYVEWHAQMIRLYLVPALGHHRLNTLTADHVLELRNHLQQNLAPRSVRSVMKILERAMNQAVESRKVAFNPCLAIKTPKVPRSNRTALSVDESRALLAAIRGHRLALLYEVALLYGPRKGELLGLRWSDVDLEGMRFHITGQVQTIGGETKRHDRTKTEDSRRTLPLTPYLESRFREQWAMLQQERRSERWIEHGLVFPSEVGTPMTPRNLSTHYYDALVRAELIASVAPAPKAAGVAGPKPTKRKAIGPKIPFHVLRHTALTRLAEVAPRHVVQAIAGHAPGDVTDGYLHATETEMRQAISRLEETLKVRRAA